MTRSHVRVFRVRYDECDASGQVRGAVYLRYLQEAAFDASAAAGFGLAVYSALGRLWLAHSTRIDFHQPLAYGDSLAVTTWVADFARVRSRRQYELRHAASGAVVARAYTDWVFVDAATGRPAAVPDEIVRAFWPDGDAPALPRAPLPAPPPAPPDAFQARRPVEWRDVDSAGIVNNPNYLAYVEEAGLAACAARGWTAARLQAAGLDIRARRYWLEHSRSAGLGDELQVHAWVAEVGAASAAGHYTLTRSADGARVARVLARYACLDRRTLQPVRIPPELRADLAAIRPTPSAPAAGGSDGRQPDSG